MFKYFFIFFSGTLIRIEAINKVYNFFVCQFVFNFDVQFTDFPGSKFMYIETVRDECAFSESKAIFPNYPSFFKAVQRYIPINNNPMSFS